MKEVKDDILKKVTGGTLGEEIAEVIWGSVGTILIPILDGLRTDPTYGSDAGCILQVIQNKGLGSFSATQVTDACERLLGANQIKTNEIATEYIQAIFEFANGN